MPVANRLYFQLFFTGQNYNVILTHWFFLHITRKKTLVYIHSLSTSGKNQRIVLFFPASLNKSQKNSVISPCIKKTSFVNEKKRI